VRPRLAFLLDLGTALLENGAETPRAEETLAHAARALGLPTAETMVTPSGIWVTVEEDGETATAVRRVRRRELALWRLVALNDLSRRMRAEVRPLVAWAEALAAIRTQAAPYPPGAGEVGGGLAAAAFAGLIGAGAAETLAAFVLGVAGTAIRRAFRGYFGGRFLAVLSGGVLSGFAGQAARLAFGAALRPDVLIPAGILVLVPGLQLTNAVRDVIHGDLLSAGSLFLEAFVLSLGIATGVALGIGLALELRRIV
jgi:uncharacterized membrane protein YjjP (DUF1212 family)